MKKYPAVLALSVLALVSAFMPLATAGGYFASISYLGGITNLLYLIPFALGAVAVAGMMGKKSLPLSKMVFWIGILGVLITAISYYAGMEHIQAFANFAGNFSREWSAFGNGNSTVAHKALPVSVSPGFGAIGAGCAYICAVITSFWPEGV